ncbi:MAG TPA: hypothetical protein VF841_00505 [Anaeromyxobacter sp.]
MLATALTALLLSAAPQLEAGVSAGAGYDSDLNHADPSVAAVGAGFGALKANGGASVDLGDSTNLYGGLRFDGETYPSYPDLSTGALGAELSLAQQLGDRTAIVLTPWVAQGWSGDPSRNATTLAGQATLRWKPLRDLTLRGFYGYTNRGADDPVFSSVKNRVGAGVEWRLLSRTYLSLAGYVERGDEVFYRATSSGSGGYGMLGMRSASFGQGEEPYRVAATTQAVSPALELGLGDAFHLLASFEARHVASRTASFDTYSLFLGLGARL